MPNSLIQNLTKSEAKNAIYLDFEGNLNKPPTYAGTVIDASYSGTFFEPIFESVAKNKKLELSTLQTFSEEIVHRAQTEKRVILAWSKHELGLLDQLTPEITKHYRDANKLVMKFFKEKRKPTIKNLKKQIKDKKEKGEWGPARIGLKDLLKLDYVDYNYPSHLSDFSPGTSLREVRNQLENKKPLYKNLSRGAKAYLTDLIKYNEHDCRGMQHLIEYVFDRRPTEDSISY